MFVLYQWSVLYLPITYFFMLVTLKSTIFRVITYDILSIYVPTYLLPLGGNIGYMLSNTLCGNYGYLVSIDTYLPP